MALVACSSGTRNLGPFTISFALDTSAAGACLSERCQDYGMSCGARVAIHIRDVEDQVDLVNQCDTVAASTSLCELGAVSRPTFFNLPPHRVRIEVAAWRQEVLDSSPALAGDCPSSEIFDLAGRPAGDFQPQPAFAGAAYFDVSTDLADVVIPLTCSEPAQLDAAECVASEKTLVTALVDDSETLLDLTQAEAANLTVGVAEPRGVADGVGGTAYVIDASETNNLPPQIGPIPSFAALVDRAFGAQVCTVVLEATPQSTATAVCQFVLAGADPLDIHGSFLPKSTLDPILAAGGDVQFPGDGLVVGRVVDDAGAALGGVTVTPATGSVAYLSSDRASFIGNETSSNGYFVARDAPFGTRWTAIDNTDGRREDGEYFAGLIRGKVTVLQVRMQPP